MKKTILILLMSALVAAGAMADDFYMGFGGVAALNGENQAADTFRFQGFAGYGVELTDSLILGAEGWFSTQLLDEQSYTYTTLVQISPEWFYLENTEYSYELWNWDLSPRLFAKLRMSDKMSLSGFLGWNFNKYEVAYFVNGEQAEESQWNDGPNQQQAVAGLRFNINWFYVEYNRIFNLDANGDANFNDIAANKLGLGLYLQF